jgi:hypothetical protein
MTFSRQEHERQRQREETRRQEAIARRHEEDLERAREEARREEARMERLAFEAELEAARVRRDAFMARIHDGRRRERDAADRLAARRSAVLDRIREDQQEQKRAAEAASDRRERLREDTVEAKRLEELDAQREAIRVARAAEARREAARGARTASERRAALQSERRAAARAARGEDRREPSSSAGGEEAGSAADDRARAEQRERARNDRAERARRDTEAANRATAARDASRAARLEEARSSRQSEERESAARAQAAADAAAERRAADAAARRQADLVEQARATSAADRREAEREARTSAELAAERRERQRAERASTERTGGMRDRSRQDRRAARPPGPAAPAAPAREPLNDPIPSGALSGSLPWLRVEGTRLVTIAGHPVTLRGVNVPGLGPPGSEHDLVAAGLDEQGLEALLGLGGNAVRVPIDRDRVLVGAGGRSPLDYLAELDRIVEQVAAHGTYTVLSLRTLGDVTFGTLPDGSGGRVPNPLAPQPDYDCIGLWRALGERFADEPAVLFDLFAAPHAALPDDLTGMDANWERWSLWVRLAVAEVHRAHPRAICIVAGLDWGTDLGGFPILGTANEPIPNLVYGATVAADRPEPSLRAVARGLPIVVTELDAPANNITARAAMLAGLGIGWIATARTDRPFVAPSRGGRLEPTVLGSSIRRSMTAIPERPLVEPPRRPPAARVAAI